VGLKFTSSGVEFAINRLVDGKPKCHGMAGRGVLGKHSLAEPRVVNVSQTHENVRGRAAAGDLRV